MKTILDFAVCTAIGIGMAYALVHWSMDDPPIYVAKTAEQTTNQGAGK